MYQTLLTTKLYFPPVRPRRVPRPVLVERLQSGLEGPLIDKALAFLVERLPPRMHLAILTRSDPALPLARLRARSQLVEIRLEHLRFSMMRRSLFSMK